jgi:type I restriction enzyme S subunit
MNADRLLAHYEKIADAPDAIAHLRRFILDLAVRGKLVPQDSNEEPASELLKRIVKEKARLVEAGEIGKFNGPETVALDEQPFGIPQNWKWVRLRDILMKLTDGTHHSPPNGPTGDFKYITAKNIKNEGVLLDDITYVSRKVHREIFARCNPAKGDILYIKDGATTGVVTINDLDEQFSMLSSVALLKLPVCIFNRLVVEFLRSPFFYDQMRGFMKGAAITRVTLKRMGPALIPLPPLVEQRRIVGKVDELMVLCDRLVAARGRREAMRDRLVVTTLARLNAPDPEIFQADVRFTLEAVPALTTRSDHVRQLRKTILNLAVRGKLVPQDSNDEPASELLKEIAKEKARLGLKNVTLPLEPDEVPFDLPIGWSWSRIGEICSKTGSGSTPRGGKEVYKPSGVAFLRSQNVYDDGLRLDDVAYIDPATHDRMSGTQVKPGDLLLNITGGSMGRCCLVPSNFNEANISQHVAIIRVGVAGLEKFLHQLILSPYFQAFIFDEQTGAGRGGLPKNRMDLIAVALPPLAEQHRIAAKVDELMSLCDRLEASLTSAVTTRRRLLDALLAESLAPIEDRELEAAE